MLKNTKKVLKNLKILMNVKECKKMLENIRIVKNIQNFKNVTNGETNRPTNRARRCMHATKNNFI